MLASILVPILDGTLENCALESALWLARKGGGSIHMLAIIDLKAFEIPVLGTADGFMPSVVSPPIAESQALLEDLTAVAREHLDQVLAVFRERGVPCSSEIKTGMPGEMIAREAVSHDIVIMSRTGYTRTRKPEDRTVDPLVSHVIRGSMRPVLVAGKSFSAAGSVNSLMAAYDGSTHAARALNVMLELAGSLGIECVLTTIASTEAAGNEILAPAAAFLSHHGIKAIRKVAIGSRASELLCDLVSPGGSQILIMGAYGHSPIREMLFGCTTERVLSHCDATVILQS
jgi:nucleotide-binding universal stress UspA family protein